MTNEETPINVFEDFSFNPVPDNKVFHISGFTPSIPWPDPTPDELDAYWFNKIWDAIKTWDINVPEAYVGYEGATGNHVVHILHALNAKPENVERNNDHDFDDIEQWR